MGNVDKVKAGMYTILRISLWPPRMCFEQTRNLLTWFLRLSPWRYHWMVEDDADSGQTKRCEEGSIRDLHTDLQIALQRISDLETKEQLSSRNHDKVMQDAQQRIQELEVLLQTSESEKQEVLTSQVAAQQLRNANPNLADLSDSFRPGKLAELCNEIYDNEWSTAYDDLDGEGLENEDCERLLLDIVMKCHSFCHEKGKVQMDFILEWFVDSQGDDGTTSKLLKDERRKKATVMLPKVEKELFIMLNQDDSLSEHPNLLALPGVQAYIRACVNLCWRMAVQDPPCILYCPGSSHSATRPLPASTQSQLPTGQDRETTSPGVASSENHHMTGPVDDTQMLDADSSGHVHNCEETEEQTGQLAALRHASLEETTRPLFDQQILKAYTDNGTHIKYLVWPCMLLHEGGPLLNKGVAQGCSEH